MKASISRIGRTWLIAVISTVSLTAEIYTWTGAVSSEWSQPANWSPNIAVPGAADTAIINSGAPAVAGELSVARLELTGGSLDGPGALTVTEAFVWNGSSMMQGAGSTIVGPNASATLSGAGDRNLSGRTLINQGNPGAYQPLPACLPQRRTHGESHRRVGRSAGRRDLDLWGR
jgi:hypothetical protein